MPRSLTFSAATILFAATLSLRAYAADPCTFLTTAQVTAAMGIPVNDGTPGPKNCIWHAIKSNSNLYMTLRDSATYSTFKAQVQALGHASPVTGIGDDAFFMGDEKSSALYVLKGSQVLLIIARVAGNTVAQNQAIEKAIASQAIGKL